MTPNNDKNELRQTLLATRESLKNAHNEAANQAIMAQLLALSVLNNARAAFVYVSADGEVDTRCLIDALGQLGVMVVVPRIIDKTRMDAVEFPGWEAMQPGPLGILAPHSDKPWDGETQVEVAIISGLGFTLAGDRLGYGAGYYDRWLASHLEIAKIGITYDCQITEHIPTANHDIRMDYVVTETRLARITRVKQ